MFPKNISHRFLASAVAEQLQFFSELLITFNSCRMLVYVFFNPVVIEISVSYLNQWPVLIIEDGKNDSYLLMCPSPKKESFFIDLRVHAVFRLK